jgi:hypothetical protein
MRTPKAKCSTVRPLILDALSPAPGCIPVEFTSDFSHSITTTIEPPDFMNNPALEKPLLPALFQIAARADDLTRPLAKGREALAEAMLDAKRLEAILKAIGTKKKAASRESLSAK